MNDESKDDKIVKQEINIDNEDTPESPVDNTQADGSSTCPDSVNKDKAGGSRSVDTGMLTVNFSLASETAPVATNIQACESYSPTTSSSFHDPGRLNRYEAAEAGPSASLRYDTNSYSSLKALGINRRRKFIAPTDNSSIVENGEVKNTAAGLDQYSNNQTMTRLDPLVDSTVDEESAVENRCLTVNSTSSDINSTCLTPLEKQLEELENIKSYSSGIESPVVATGVVHSKLGLQEALMQIVEEQSLKHTSHQQGRSCSPEFESFDSPSLEHTKDDEHLKFIDVKSHCSDTESSHLRHSILKICNEEEGLENYKITQTPSELSSPKLAERSRSTVNRKKSVHFADSHGLDLAAIRLVANTDSPPEIPQYVLDNLWMNQPGEQKEASLMFLFPCFEQPGADLNFFKKVLQQQICLENVLVSEMTVNGYVRVFKTLHYPSVIVRYSIDNWSTINEIYATHIFATPDDRTERYSFVIDSLPLMEPGSFLELVLVMTCNNIEYFDSNDGHNYKFECVRKLTSMFSW